MNSTVFPVDDEPYCLWESDLSERNLAFLKGLDPGYFGYFLHAHLASEDEQRAAVALQLSLHHSTEAMFSLLGAAVQAPHCVHAWIAKCSNTQLRRVIARMCAGDSTILTARRTPLRTWAMLAQAVFAWYQPGTERQTCVANGFAGFWSRRAAEFSTI